MMSGNLIKFENVVAQIDAEEFSVHGYLSNDGEESYEEAFKIINSNR